MGENAEGTTPPDELLFVTSNLMISSAIPCLYGSVPPCVNASDLKVTLEPIVSAEKSTSISTLSPGARLNCVAVTGASFKPPSVAIILNALLSENAIL